ncbi:DMT family transporter [Salipiger sp.]|uniref:DMT family transporter n=1 Tax=Salipiger sp. TaxID=2078585 RepID=UPI003A98816F
MALRSAAPIHSAPPLQRPPDNMRGIILMAAGFFAFGVTDMLAKLLTSELHPFQIVWFRQLGLLAGVLVLLSVKGFHVLRTPHPVLQITRGAAAVTSACLFIFALRYVPLADATAVTFIAPFIVTILGAVLLREPVGIRRWLAVGAGFIGMLIVIRPGAGVFHPAIFFVVLAAFVFSARQLLSRMVSGDDSIATTVSYTSITAALLISIPLPFVWVTPDHASTYLLAFGMTVGAALGESLIIRALDVAQAVVVTPVHYSLIIWGTLYGYIVFADLPDAWTFLGCAIIVASGLYTLNRERIAARRKKADAA